MGNVGKVTQNCRKNQHEFDLLEVSQASRCVPLCCVPFFERILYLN